MHNGEQWSSQLSKSKSKKQKAASKRSIFSLALFSPGTGGSCIILHFVVSLLSKYSDFVVIGH